MSIVRLQAPIGPDSKDIVALPPITTKVRPAVISSEASVKPIQRRHQALSPIVASSLDEYSNLMTPDAAMSVVVSPAGEKVRPLA